jgi:hypothetical protein
MHRGKKHTESSYQPIKDKSGKVILTSEQAKNVDEDHHEFDHKPSQSEVNKAAFINAKIKKMRKESQQRKAVTDLNKALETSKAPQRKSALNMLGVSSPLDKRGLWDNIHAKRKRGEAPNKPGDKGYPTDKALRDSQ